MPKTRREKQDLERFGCTFRERSRTVYIDSTRKAVGQISKASIFACLGRLSTASGPVILLAIEISTVRPLPNYCYFPFDLRKKSHREYLTQIAETGEIGFSFATNKGTHKRIYRLTAYLRLRASEIYAQALNEWEMLEPGARDFATALETFEKRARIPDFVNRLLLEDTLAELLQELEREIENVPQQNLDYARALVNEGAQAFLPHYEQNKEAFLETLRQIRNAFTCAIDTHRAFYDDPEGFLKFLSDALAASLSATELANARNFINLAVSIPNLPFKGQESTATKPILSLPPISAELTALVRSMTAGISKDAATRFFAIIGLTTGGKPGRPIKDYSREYDLKMSGKSWTEVARHAMAERAELQSEFQVRTFDALDRSDQEKVWNRLRQGVKAHAKRAGKPVPPEPEILDAIPESKEKKT